MKGKTSPIAIGIFAVLILVLGFMAFTWTTTGEIIPSPTPGPSECNLPSAPSLSS